MVPPPNDLLTGPPLVGITLNWFLFGVLAMQYFMYWNHVARKDTKLLQAIVHFLFLLDFAQTIMTMLDAFHWFVYNFGNYEALDHSGLSGIDAPVMDGLIAVIVQLVYCWRVWVLSGWRAFPAFIAVLAIGTNISAMAVGISDSLVDFSHQTKPSQWLVAVWVWLWGSAATDILIAGSMIYLLGIRSKCYNQGLRVATRRILILILETNAITALVAMTFAIIPQFPSIAPPFTNLHVIGGYTLGKLYSNCFMVLLNQRMSSEEPSRDSSATPDSGTARASSIDIAFCSGNSRTAGEISMIQFSEITSQGGHKARCDDLELGQVPEGMKVEVKSLVGSQSKRSTVHKP